MLNQTLSGWSKSRLQLVLSLFFLALAIPTIILIYQSYSQLKWESFHYYREQAEELTNQINRRYQELIETESARTFTDYSFLNIAGNIKSKVLQRSPLSDYPVSSKFPGLIGYFQVDNNGQFSTPLLAPKNAGRFDHQQEFGISSDELEKRSELHQQVFQLLSANKLLTKPDKQESKKKYDFYADEERSVQDKSNAKTSVNNISSGILSLEPVTEAEAPAPVVASPQAAFDQLQSQELFQPQEKANQYSKLRKRVEDLKLKKKYQADIETRKKSEIKLKRQQLSQRRIESNILPEYLPDNKEVKKDEDLKINMFESEIDAFEFSLLESGHFVLYRKVWRNSQRFIQGLLLKQDEFIRKIIGDTFYKTKVSIASNLTLAYKGNIITTMNNRASRRSYSDSINSWNADDLEGTLLLQSSLSSPLEHINLIFSVNKLPVGPGGTVIVWLSIILLLILCGGFTALYLIGLKQLNLARQQQDFISSVSHELKTPLTSIRMYGEMLREGWTTEEKRKQYYDYIYDESERLTRLINNVLQLARMTRNELAVDLKEYSISELIDNLKSKISSQVERAEFDLAIDCSQDIAGNKLFVDVDFFIQVFINLIDNAIKFSMKSGTRNIDISCKLLSDGDIQFSIRDYGPGINKDQMKKIFQLFYRSENELTRETVGTGIGLSLVKELVTAMNGKINVINKEPGTEFRVIFSTVKDI